MAVSQKLKDQLRKSSDLDRKIAANFVEILHERHIKEQKMKEEQ